MTIVTSVCSELVDGSLTGSTLQLVLGVDIDDGIGSRKNEQTGVTVSIRIER